MNFLNEKCKTTDGTTVTLVTLHTGKLGVKGAALGETFSSLSAHLDDGCYRQGVYRAGRRVPGGELRYAYPIDE